MLAVRCTLPSTGSLRTRRGRLEEEEEAEVEIVQHENVIDRTPLQGRGTRSEGETVGANF